MEKISMKHVRALRGSGEEIVFINVLPKEEYLKSHIPGSINIPLSNEGEFVQRVEEIVPSKNQKIVLYCADADCTASENAAKQLDKRGFSFVMVFKGGLQEWIEEGGKLEAGKHAKALTR